MFGHCNNLCLQQSMPTTAYACTSLCLHQLCTPLLANDALSMPSYLVKRGMGQKKSVMGMSVRGFKNLKKRFFVLSNEGLSYHKDKGGIFKLPSRLILLLGHPMLLQAKTLWANFYLVILLGWSAWTLLRCLPRYSSSGSYSCCSLLLLSQSASVVALCFCCCSLIECPCVSCSTPFRCCCSIRRRSTW